MALVCDVNDALSKCSRDDDSMISKENVFSATDTELMSNIEDACQVRFHGCVGCLDDPFPVVGLRGTDGQLEKVIILCTYCIPSDLGTALSMTKLTCSSAFGSECWVVEHCLVDS